MIGAVGAFIILLTVIAPVVIGAAVSAVLYYFEVLPLGYAVLSWAVLSLAISVTIQASIGIRVDLNTVATLLPELL